MIKRIVWSLIVLLLFGGLGLVAIGGREGAMVLYVKYILRKHSAPFREVNWQAGPASPQPGDKKRPNIIVILADDLGFNDITFYGGGIAGGSVPTPNIDAIARDGVNFTQGYAGNATCAPSRAAMMTGRYATRFGFEFTPVPVEFARLVGKHHAPGSLRDTIYYAERERDMPVYEDMGLPTSEVTIAKLLKGAGYHTLHLGKWHLGDSPQYRSYAHGFDESLSLQHGASMFLPERDSNVVNSKQDFDMIDQFLWASAPWGVRFNDGEVFEPRNYLTDYLTDEAVKAIAANRNRPFMMYLAYNAPHTPLQATRADYEALSHIQDQTTRVYAAMIRSLDRNVGRVMKALKDQGIDDNTLVVFTSDNGGANYIGVPGLNLPYRGWKATFFDGGTHVPYFMRWPGTIPPNTRYESMVSHFDIFGTAAAAAGAQAPTDRIIDGVNLLPFVRGEAAGKPHDRLFWRGGDYRVVRDGDWKLQLTQLPKQDWLYNLARDPGEKNNLAASEPAKVAELKALIEGFNKQQAKPLWPALVEGAFTLDKTLREPQSADDAYIYWAN